MIAGIILFVVVSGNIGDTISVSDEKMLTLNDIVKDVEENMDSLDSLGEKDYGVDYIVMDSVGKELYRTPGADKKLAKITCKNERFTIESAGKRRLPYKYVIKDERIIGSVILLDSLEDGYTKIKHKLVVGMTIMALIFIMGAVIYGVYIDRSIIKPFNRMQSFAGKVAEGKLDEPLLMEENNMFGAFTESFDIMREELAESKKREIELQRKEKELIASLSHDLKTPITGIKLTTELLEAKLDRSKELELQRDTDVLDKLDNIYKKASLVPTQLADGSWAFLREINWRLVDDMGRTNVQRVMAGLAPIDSTGMPYELHHIGMKADSPLAILTNAEHHSKANYSILHWADEGKNVTDAAWNAQKKEFWNAILKMAQEAM